MSAAEACQRGIDVEVIDIRTLNPVDIETISTSVQKTGKCVVAQEAPKTMGFAAEISALIMERCFLSLEHLYIAVRFRYSLSTPMNMITCLT